MKDNKNENNNEIKDHNKILAIAIIWIALGVATFVLLWFTLGPRPKFISNMLSGCNIKFSVTGTYYLQQNEDKVDKSTYIVLDNGNVSDGFNTGNWRDNDGLHGKYVYSSGNLTFYDSNKNLVIAEGTIEKNVLKLTFDGHTYIKYVKT